MSYKVRLCGIQSPISTLYSKRFALKENALQNTYMVALFCEFWHQIEFLSSTKVWTTQNGNPNPSQEEELFFSLKYLNLE